MTIRQQGGVFGRHPKFESIEVDGRSDLGPVTVTDATLPVTVNRTGGNGRHATFQDNGSDRGGIAEHNFDLYFGTPSSGFRVSRFNSYIGPRTVDDGAATLDLGNPSTNQWRNLYLSGNVILGTAGAGIDFSATSGTGSSELFDDYEEGTWTPAFSAEFTTPPTVTSAQYTKIGRQVTVTMLATGGVVTAGGSIGGLPFASNSAQGAGAYGGNSDTTKSLQGTVGQSASSITNIPASTLTGNTWQITATYFTNT